MNPLWICLTSAAVFVGSIAGGPQQRPLRFDEFHHEYIGVSACALGAATHFKFLTRVGAFIAADDAIQHLYQRVNNDLTITSPLTLGYRVTIGATVPVQRLNRWLDKVLGHLLR